MEPFPTSRSVRTAVELLRQNATPDVESLAHAMQTLRRLPLSRGRPSVSNSRAPPYYFCRVCLSGPLCTGVNLTGPDVDVLAADGRETSQSCRGWRARHAVWEDVLPHGRQSCEYFFLAASYCTSWEGERRLQLRSQQRLLSSGG